MARVHALRGSGAIRRKSCGLSSSSLPRCCCCCVRIALCLSPVAPWRELRMSTPTSSALWLSSPREAPLTLAENDADCRRALSAARSRLQQTACTHLRPGRAGQALLCVPNGPLGLACSLPRWFGSPTYLPQRIPLLPTPSLCRVCIECEAIASVWLVSGVDATCVAHREGSAPLIRYFLLT
eukprot:360255-Chlamydomonas_euryale.AAC.6